MECSPRGGGNRLSEMVRYITGLDLIEGAVRAALGLEFNQIEQKEIKDNWGEIILHSETSGIFDSLWISNEIKDNIVEKDLWIKSGTEVGGFSGANEAIGTLVLKFKTKEELTNVLNNQEEYIKIILK